MQENTTSTPVQTETVSQTQVYPHHHRVLFHHEPHQHQPRNINALHAAERQGVNDRIAVAITKGFGSMTALYILIIWMFGWMALATAGIWLFAKDSYPFPFLLFCSNLVQLWALPAIMVGQNVLNRKTELQADEDFRINQESFRDIEQIMQHLSAQDAELVHHAHMLEHLLEKNGISLQQLLAAESTTTSHLEPFVQPQPAASAPTTPAPIEGEKKDA
jgi:uncharacterized membrane protein